VSVRILTHLLLFTISLEGVRKIEHRTRVTAVHETSQGGTFGHASDQFREDGVVANLASTLVVDWNQCLVVSILFVAVIILETTSVSRVVEEGTISTFCLGSKLPKGSNDIVVGWWGMSTVILKGGTSEC
jgi:hypothetical protein